MNRATWPRWLVAASVAAITILLGFFDWRTGYELNFFVFYFIPVSLAAWKLNMAATLIESLFAAMVWYAADSLSAHPYAIQAHAVWNTMIRLVSFALMGWALSRIRDLLRSEREVSERLRKSLSEIRVLEGLVPVCAQCKKIRDEHGAWQHMEVYISENTNARFTHGYCPECARRVMEEAGMFADGTRIVSKR